MTLILMIISYFCIAWRLAFYFVLCPYRSIQRSSGRFPPARGTRFQTGILLWLIKEQSEMTYQYVTHLYHYGKRLIMAVGTSLYILSLTFLAFSSSMWCLSYFLSVYIHTYSLLCLPSGLFFSHSSFMFLLVFIFLKYLMNFLPGPAWSFVIPGVQQ